MEKLIINTLILVLFLVILATVAINAGLIDNPIVCLINDPNDDEPEYICLASNFNDDPNDERPERMFIGDGLDNDPNEDEPERALSG